MNIKMPFVHKCAREVSCTSQSEILPRLCFQMGDHKYFGQLLPTVHYSYCTFLEQLNFYFILRILSNSFQLHKISCEIVRILINLCLTSDDKTALHKDAAKISPVYSGRCDRFLESWTLGRRVWNSLYITLKFL